MSENEMIAEFKKNGMSWPSRSQRWQNLTRTLFMSPNPQYLVIYGKKGTPEEGKPIAAQGWAKVDGVFLGQGLRNPAGIERKGYATDVSREAFILGNRKPALLFANNKSYPIFRGLGFKDANLEDVKSLSQKIGEDFVQNIPDFHRWGEKLVVLK